jgi:Zn-dependent protease
MVLWPLGGFTVFGSSDGAVVDDLWIAISGPLTHVVQGAFWLGLYALINQGDLSSFSTLIQRQDLRNCGVGEFTSILSEQALLMNVIIFIFNVCIPAYPFDGGRALAALLVMGGLKLGTAARITSALGTFVGIVMLFVGVYLYVTLTSAGSLFLILVAGFIISSGSRMWKAAVSNRLHDHPLFQLECYRNRSGRRAHTSTNVATAPPRSSEVPKVINSHII